MAVRRRRKKKTINPRFAALCLALVFFLGAAVYLAASRGLPGEDVQTPDYVEKDYLTVNEWSRPGTAAGRYPRRSHPLCGKPGHHRPRKPQLF